MGFRGVSCMSQETDSMRAGLEVARALREGMGQTRPAAVLVYATINHDQPVLLRGLREGLGPGVQVVGCSAQGVMADGKVIEGGFVVGAMAFGGEGLKVAAARVDAVHEDGRAKGRELGASLRKQLGTSPKLTVLLYDPLGGVDVNLVLEGARPSMGPLIVGGAASQPAGPLAGTYQYLGDQVFEKGAVALGMTGDFSVDLGVCHGTVPTGIVMSITRADGNRVLELDGRPALEVWRESMGTVEDDDHFTFNQEHIAAVAMGVERQVIENGSSTEVYLIRSVFGVDREAKAIILQAAIPEGSKVMFHHRTVKVVREGTRLMAQELSSRLAGKKPWAILGFECGGRTTPFLGPAETLEENLELHRMLAPQSPWLGLIAWGEIAPCGGQPEFHNYTYPLAVLCG
jgi:hypothetical protein